MIFCFFEMHEYVNMFQILPSPFLPDEVWGSPGIHSVLCEHRQRSQRLTWLLIHGSSPGGTQRCTSMSKIFTPLIQYSDKLLILCVLPQLPPVGTRCCEVGGCHTPPCSQTEADAGPKSAPSPQSRRYTAALAPEQLLRPRASATLPLLCAHSLPSWLQTECAMLKFPVVFYHGIWPFIRPLPCQPTWV